MLWVLPRPKFPVVRFFSCALAPRKCSRQAALLEDAVTKLDSDQIAEIREIFDHYDGDSNGYIDRREFADLLDALDAGLDEDELDVGFAEVDANKNGRISFSEFIAWWSDR